MANMDDAVTVLKNIVTSFNSLVTAFYSVDAVTGANGISTATVVKTGSARLVTLSVVVGGTTAGTINDTTTVAGASASNVVCGIPTTAGVYSIYMICNNGLVVVPGSGQVCSIAYS
jgi:hypothetical protein